MIFICFKGLMTKWTFLIKKHSMFTGSCYTKLKELQCSVCALQLPKKGFSMVYNPILIQLWKFLSYFYPHFSLIDMYLFLALSDPTCYLKTNLSRAWFSFQHKKTPFTYFLNLLNKTSGSSFSSQADNSAFCTLTLLSGGKMERLIMWTVWQTEKSAASELQQSIASAVYCLIFHAMKHMKPN